MLHKMLYDQNKSTAHTCSSYLLLKKPKEDKAHSFARNVRTSRPVQLPFSTTSTIPLYSTGFLSPTQFLVQILWVFLQPQAWVHLSTSSHTLKMPSMAALPWKCCTHTGSMAGMGGAALVAAVALPREGDAHFPQGINRILTVTATLSHLASTWPHPGATQNKCHCELFSSAPLRPLVKWWRSWSGPQL